MRGGLSPIEARRLVGQQDRVEHTGPSQRAHAISRAILLFVVFAAVIGLCGAWAARAAEPERVWVVVNVATGAPWTSPKGHQATATNETACLLATVDAARFTPAGTRLACRKTSTK